MSLMSYTYAREYMNDARVIDYEQRSNTRADDTKAISPLLNDPLGALAALPAGRNRRISSNELPKWK
jgi:hypothetical protein